MRIDLTTTPLDNDINDYYGYWFPLAAFLMRCTHLEARLLYSLDDYVYINDYCYWPHSLCVALTWEPDPCIP